MPFHLDLYPKDPDSPVKNMTDPQPCFRVYDEDTGRVRLVKGSGEILEECVSRERQQNINKQVTILLLKF